LEEKASNSPDPSRDSGVSPEQRYRLRLALSYRDRVRRADHDVKTAFAEGRIDEAKHHSLRTFYSDHLVRAENQVARERAELRRCEATLDQHVLRLQRDQLRLSDQIAAGRMSAAKANRKNRELTQELSRLLRQITEIDVLMAVATSTALGGAIEHELDDYEPRLKAARFRAPFARTRRRILIGGVVTIVVLGGIVLGVPRIVTNGGMRMTLMPMGADNTISLLVESGASREGELLVPWPEGIARAPMGTGTRGTYGVSAYVQEREQGAFRLWADSGACWLHRGRSVMGGTSIPLVQGVPVELVFDPRGLRQDGLEVRAVRIELSRGDGHVVSSEVVSLVNPYETQSVAPE
jgi:hypothetical protein